MQRFGKHSDGAREMAIDDIMHCRADLLARMANDYLRGTPLGDRQKSAMEMNAACIQQECSYLMENEEITPDDAPPDASNDFRIRLMHLASAVKAVANGSVVNRDHKVFMQDHTDFITGALEDEDHDDEVCIESCLSIMLLKLFAIF